MTETAPLTPPPESIVEVCGVVSMREELMTGDMRMLHCHTVLPGLAEYDVKLQPSEVGVLRFDNPDPDEPEQVWVFNSSLEEFSDTYFTNTGRHRLRILSPARAAVD